MKYLISISLLLFSITSIATTKAWIKDKHEWVEVDQCYKNDRGGYSATINGQTLNVDRCAIKNNPKPTGTLQISNNVTAMPIQGKSSLKPQPKKPINNPQIIKPQTKPLKNSQLIKPTQKKKKQ